MLPVTAIYASLFALLFLILSGRVIVYRRRNLVSLGDKGDNRLLKMMRAHSNAAEYAPIAILLLGFLELAGADVWFLHGLGTAFIVGRLAHAIGFSTYPQIMQLRIIGMVLTLTMILVSAVSLIVIHLI